MLDKILIDSINPDDVRVVTMRGNQVEDFDFKSSAKKQIKGNIYHVKISRIEPSLDAAFIDYGSERHGFLPLSEIHPDYYQIPQSARQKILEETTATLSEEVSSDLDSQGFAEETLGLNEDSGIESADSSDSPASLDLIPESDESVFSEDSIRQVPLIASYRRQKYKINDVIKRRQSLLVQVIKEERGNKGVFFSTYLSLAGRYCVLMPNSIRGPGGISKKISGLDERARMKEVVQELDVPQGMGVILRTAGVTRTKNEIKRDFESLLRLWDEVRDAAIQSTAPQLVYEESSLIKRTIRDLYSKEVEEIMVSGDKGYREAKDYMRTLMPSHAKSVRQFKSSVPIFTYYGVEKQLDELILPRVPLPSGGYIVINQTEALVAIDVNSGRANKEYNAENTAFQTNLEAAREIARQLRLRDLAGLIVIDFIDMEERRNTQAVEMALKDCIQSDRARVKLGRISSFGLLEMSRQRIRSGIHESCTHVCPLCDGGGVVRSVDNQSMHVLRILEDRLLNGSTTHNLIVRTRSAIAMILLNQYRNRLYSLEERFGISITIVIDGNFEQKSTWYNIELGTQLAGLAASSSHTNNSVSSPVVLKSKKILKKEGVKTQAANPVASLESVSPNSPNSPHSSVATTSLCDEQPTVATSARKRRNNRRSSFARRRNKRIVSSGESVDLDKVRGPEFPAGADLGIKMYQNFELQ